MTPTDRILALTDALAAMHKRATTAEACHASVIDTLRAEAEAPCDGSCYIALASRQVGPDGSVPGNARECAEAWEREAARLWRAHRDAEARAEQEWKRANAAESEAADLRAKLTAAETATAHEWWTRHHAECGVTSRGCHHYCPKDMYERAVAEAAESALSLARVDEQARAELAKSEARAAIEAAEARITEAARALVAEANARAEAAEGRARSDERTAWQEATGTLTPGDAESMTRAMESAMRADRAELAALKSERDRLIASEGNIARERAQAEAEEERLAAELATLTAERDDFATRLHRASRAEAAYYLGEDGQPAPEDKEERVWWERGRMVKATAAPAVAAFDLPALEWTPDPLATRGGSQSRAFASAPMWARAFRDGWAFYAEGRASDEQAARATCERAHALLTGEATATPAPAPEPTPGPQVDDALSRARASTAAAFAAQAELLGFTPDELTAAMRNQIRKYLAPPPPKAPAPAPGIDAARLAEAIEAERVAGLHGVERPSWQSLTESGRAAIVRRAIAALDAIIAAQVTP